MATFFEEYLLGLELVDLLNVVKSLVHLLELDVHVVQILQLFVLCLVLLKVL